MPAYLELKLSWELFQRAPQALNAEERQTGQNRPPPATVGSGDFIQSAKRKTCGGRRRAARAAGHARRALRQPRRIRPQVEPVGLNQTSQPGRRRVLRDLRVEALLEHGQQNRTGQRRRRRALLPRKHPQAFSRRKTRTMRHILVTFNNSREQVKTLALLDKVRRTRWTKTASPGGAALFALPHRHAGAAR